MVARNKKQSINAGGVFIGDPGPQTVSHVGVRDERGVVFGYAQVALGQRHLHEIYERPEERPAFVHLAQELWPPVFRREVGEGRSGTVPGREQEAVLGPGEHPWYGPEAIDGRVLYPAR